MAQVQACVGIKSDGDVCGRRCSQGNVRCTTHLKTLENNGPNLLAMKELEYTQKKEINSIYDRYDPLIDAAVTDQEKRRLAEDAQNEMRQFRARHIHEKTLLSRRQQDEIERTGINPDEAANRRRLERNQAQVAERQARIALFNRLDQDLQRADNAAAVAPRVAQPNVGELRQFSQDAQNVHTTSAVNQTKLMVGRILKLAVPSDYAWNIRTCSKTPGEIIMDCKLSARGAWQMTAKYCQDENVYDMGLGIYGKVLDGVWQYVRNSPDKTDLCRILRQEMEDNIGMCAQGNLTRLCNILSGYMEGIGVQESQSEILGRKLPLLIEIGDQTTRLAEAYKLLVETGTPEDQWLSWVESLVDEGSVRLKTAGSGQTIGFEVC